MQLRPVRLALHIGAATVLAAGGVLLTGAPGHADQARPDSFGGDSTAAAFHFVADRNPQPTPVTDLIHDEFPYATSSFDSSGNATARAASFYPGAGLLGVPSLLCQVKLCLPVGAFPLEADASYPTNKDGSAPTSPGTVTNGPLTVKPNLTVAHADEDRVEATAEAAGAGVANVVSSDSSSTHSKQSFEGSTLVLTAESVVKGLDIGGQIHIDSVRSVATAKVDGGKVSASTASTTVSGASVAGQPVTIDSTGVHAGGAGDGGAAQAAVNAALKNLEGSGISMRVLAPSRVARPGAASGTAGGLLIRFAHTVEGINPPPPPNPIPGPPSVNGDYAGTVTLAGAGVSGFATPADAVDLAPFVPAAPAVVPPALGGVTPPGAASAPLTPGAPPAVAPASPSVAGAAPQSRPTASLGVDLTPKRLKVLMLFLLAYPLLVLLSAPLRAPARLPRSL